MGRTMRGWSREWYFHLWNSWTGMLLAGLWLMFLSSFRWALTRILLCSDIRGRPSCTRANRVTFKWHWRRHCWQKMVFWTQTLGLGKWPIQMQLPMDSKKPLLQIWTNITIRIRQVPSELNFLSIRLIWMSLRVFFLFVCLFFFKFWLDRVTVWVGYFLGSSKFLP